jgi:serine/threonine protein kinase
MPTDDQGSEITSLGAAFMEVLAQPASTRHDFIRSAHGQDRPFADELHAMLEAHEEMIADPGGADLADEPLEHLTLQPGTMINEFRIGERIGSGGFGEVYVAEQQSPIRRTVALKVIKPGMDTREVIARFESERQSLASLNDPAIARLLEAGATPEGRPYFVMEHVDGRDIIKHCDEERLTIEERLGLFVRACTAIRHAHEKNIIHRDIKPSNMLVTTNARDHPEPKIIDFGIAKAMSQEMTGETILTQAGALVGTPEYMAPERLSVGKSITDPRIDIYSLGVVLYELLGGSLPLDRELLKQATTSEIQRLIREHRPERPSSQLMSLDAGDASRIATNRSTTTTDLSRELRGKLDFIVLKCLRRSPQERYQTVKELQEELQRYLSGERSLSSRQSLTRVLQSRTSRVTLATAAFVVSALLLVLIISALVTPPLPATSVYEGVSATEANWNALVEEGNQLLENKQYGAAEAAYEASLRIGQELQKSDMVEWSEMRLAELMYRDGRCREAIDLLIQYSRILVAMRMSDVLLDFDEASIKPLLLYFNATRECGSKEKLLEIAMVLCHLREINATAAGMQEVIDICEKFGPRTEEDVAP